VVELNRSFFSEVSGRVGKRGSRENNRCRGASRSDDERFNAEPAGEIADTISVSVGVDVALVPGKAEGRVRNLNNEDVELRVGWKAGDFHVHTLDRVQGVDRYAPTCIRQTGLSSRRYDHVKDFAVRRLRG